MNSVRFMNPPSPALSGVLSVLGASAIRVCHGGGSAKSRLTVRHNARHDHRDDVASRCDAAATHLGHEYQRLMVPPVVWRHFVLPQLGEMLKVPGPDSGGIVKAVANATPVAGHLQSVVIVTEIVESR